MGYLWLVLILDFVLIFWLPIFQLLFCCHVSYAAFVSFLSLITYCCIVGKLLKGEDLPKEEENFQQVYVKAPSFLSIHMGVKADVLPSDTDCHHFVLEVI